VTLNPYHTRFKRVTSEHCPCPFKCVTSKHCPSRSEACAWARTSSLSHWQRVLDMISIPTAPKADVLPLVLYS